ncbi:hypothetical protein ACWV26_02595 [Rummeliibacillus sp. JY-2-4R]
MWGEDIESAINAKSLKVTFNQAANDVKESDFSVAKGSVKSNVTSVVIAADKKSATIELTSKLTKGDYTVSVKNGESTLTGTVTAADEKVAGIQVLSDVAPLADDKATATAALQVTNQYGEDVTAANYSNLDITATGTSVKAVAGETASVDNKGQITINLDSTLAKADDKVVITAVDKTTGTVTNKTITLSSSAVASDVEVGTLYNKDGETLSEDSTGDFYLPVTVKDQYGKEITDADVANTAVLVTNTNAAVATVPSSNPIESTTINGKSVLAVKVTNVAAGSTNLVFVVKATGKTAQSTVTVKAGKSIAGITLGAPTNEVVAAGEDIKLPLTLTDNEGNEIKTLKEYNAINSARGLNDLDTSTTGLSIQEINGTLYLVKDASKVTKGTSSILVTTKSGKIASQVVTVKDAAEATTITGVQKDFITSLRENDTTGITFDAADFVIEDQYGRTIDTDSSLLSGVTIEAVAALGANSPFDVTTTPGTVKLTSTPGITATSDTITFNIDNSDAKAEGASAYSKKFTVVKDADLASYSAVAVPTVALVAGDTTDYKLAGAPYTDDSITVKASTKAGETVLLDESAGEFSVKGLPTVAELTTADFKDVNGKDITEKTYNATVTINATGEKITVPVTYSIAPSKAQKLDVFTKDTDKVTSTLKVADTSVKYTTAQVLDALDFKTTDQYKVQSSALSSVDEVTFTKVSGTVSFEGNGTSTAAVKTASAGSVVKATVVVDGQSTTVEITFDAAVTAE